MLSPVKEEVFLAIVGMLLMMYGAMRGKDKSTFFLITAVALSFGAVFLSSLARGVGDAFDTLNGMIVVDQFSVWMKTLVAGGLAVSMMLSVTWLKDNKMMKFEIPLLYLFSGIGMLLMVSVNNLLALYVSLELSSLSLYVLAAIRRDHLDSTEAGLKYFILGALSSGILLFGISLVYGFTGSLSYAQIAVALSNFDGLPAGAIVGMVFILAGMTFKVSGVPFHMWTPDVYQGAPTPVTALFALVPKVAAFALIIRLVTGPFAPLHEQWSQIIEFVAVASMAVGAFAGLVQLNFKRLLAYSSIANVGYALLGLVAGDPEGVASVILYLTIYMGMTAGTFAILMGLRRHGYNLENIPDFSGLSKKAPFMAYSLAALLFSMSGLPPMAGFFAKYFVFQSLIGTGHIGVAVFGVLTSVIASYYYLRVIKIMMFNEPRGEFDPAASRSRTVVTVGSVAFILLFTIMPNYFLDHALLAAGALFP